MTLRRPDEWRRRESNPLLLGASEVLRHQSFVPERGRGGPRCGEVRAGGVEPPQLEAPGLQPGELAGCSAPARRGDRPGSNRRRGVHNPGCFLYTTATTNGDDRTRTGALSPDKRALSSSELRPRRGGRRDRLPATEGRDVAVRWPRSQLLYLSAVLPASLRRRHPLTGWPWGLIGPAAR